ncbi:MAG TPA: TetR/AcrR family transcriptional regulator [Deltaproteobacteria bacterium]|nr:TetR/AcrR family transcriptional regulator [Deltaproteobacteria bacterium]HPR52724.1 TetR/AcrR family transcriptional regulator [Deltaproteobacteria bacterium]
MNHTEETTPGKKTVSRKGAMKRVRIPQQKRSIERKKKIEKAALTLFAKKGINGTSSNEIARSAGVSIGTFYSYFENKRTLFLEILKEHLDAFVTDVYSLKSDETISIQENVRQHIDKAFAVFDRHPSFHKEALVLKFSDKDVKKLFDDVEAEQLVILSELIRPYCTNRDPDELMEISKVIHSAVENIAHSVKFLDSPLNRDRLMDELTEMIYHYVSSL